MTGSKSSETTRSVVLGFLALWSIVSLIIIVVWATSPDLKGSSQCRAQLSSSQEKLQETRQAMQEDRRALENLLEEARENLSSVEEQRNLLMGLLETTNTSLETCTMHTAVLNGNLSLLEENIQNHILTENNLTTHNALLQEEVEFLQQNVSELTLHTLACQSLQGAAESFLLAAQIQDKKCNESKLFLHTQLLRCKDVVAANSKQTSDKQKDEDQTESSSQRVTFSLVMMICCLIHITV